MFINVQEAYGTLCRQDQQRNFLHCTHNKHIITKKLKVQDKERTLGARREKDQVTYKGSPDRIIPDFLRETLKALRA